MSNYGIVGMRLERNHVRSVARATEFLIVAGVALIKIVSASNGLNMI
jgi:hypothetical protein